MPHGQTDIVTPWAHIGTKSYLFWSVDGSYGEGIVLVAAESADILLELDIVDILPLPEKNGEIQRLLTGQVRQADPVSL